MKNDIIQYLRDKSILILGYGREGQSALKFIQENLPDNAVAVADVKPLEIDGVLTFLAQIISAIAMILTSSSNPQELLLRISLAARIKKKSPLLVTFSFVSVKTLSSESRAPKAKVLQAL